MTQTTANVKPNAKRVQAGEHPPGSLLFDWVAAGLSAWLVGGLYLDGWAHNHGRVDEVIFTPWHAVLYSGGLVMIVFLVFNQSRNMSKGFAWRSALPKGYLLSLVGAALFLLGGRWTSSGTRCSVLKSIWRLCSARPTCFWRPAAYW